MADSGDVEAHTTDRVPLMVAGVAVAISLGGGLYLNKKIGDLTTKFEAQEVQIRTLQEKLVLITQLDLRVKKLVKRLDRFEDKYHDLVKSLEIKDPSLVGAAPKSSSRRARSDSEDYSSDVAAAAERIRRRRR